MTDHASEQTKRLSEPLSPDYEGESPTLGWVRKRLLELWRYLEVHDARLAAVEPRPAPPADWRARCEVGSNRHGWYVSASYDTYLRRSGEWARGTGSDGYFDSESSARAALLAAPPYPGAEVEPQRVTEAAPLKVGDPGAPGPALDPADVEAVAEAIHEGYWEHERKRPGPHAGRWDSLADSIKDSYRAAATAALRAALARGWTRPEKGAGP